MPTKDALLTNPLNALTRAPTSNKDAPSVARRLRVEKISVTCTSEGGFDSVIPNLVSKPRTTSASLVISPPSCTSAETSVVPGGRLKVAIHKIL